MTLSGIEPLVSQAIDEHSTHLTIISNTEKMVLDISLLNTQHYKVRIKGKMEQSRERSSALPYISV